MKDININYEGLSFEEKVLLKIYYYLSLPASETTRSALLNLRDISRRKNERKK